MQFLFHGYLVDIQTRLENEVLHLFEFLLRIVVIPVDSDYSAIVLVFLEQVQYVHKTFGTACIEVA